MANGFIGFNDYLNLNQGTEEELLQRAMADAEAKDKAARVSLRGVEKQGMQEGQADISQVTSYGDYLQLKRGAADAWAKLLQSADPKQRAVLQAVGARLGVGDKANAAGAMANQREAGVNADLQSMQSSRAHWADVARKKAEADAARASSDKSNREDFQRTLRSRMAADWGGLDAWAGNLESRLNPFGDWQGVQGWASLTKTPGAQRQTGDTLFTPDAIKAQDRVLAASGRTVSDAQQLQQMASNAGLGDEAARYGSSAYYDPWTGQRKSGGY